MAEAIIQGNSIHRLIIEMGLIPGVCLNTVEALKYGGKGLNKLREWVILPLMIETKKNCQLVELTFYNRDDVV